MRAEVKRETKETRVMTNLVMRPGKISVETGIPFLDHLLETLLFYMGASGEVRAVDKRGSDDHHVVEDVAIVLGKAVDKILGNREGMRRYGHAIVPMDEAMVVVAVDLGGRPYSVFKGDLGRAVVGGLSAENVPHFIRSFSVGSRSTIHVSLLYWENLHHVVEAVFKALGLAVRQAVEVVGKGIPSVKGEI